MKLSTRARYGLKALIDLGLHSENETVSLQSIAERQDISVSYLEQLMAMLKKAGLAVERDGKYYDKFRERAIDQTASALLDRGVLCKRARLPVAQ